MRQKRVESIANGQKILPLYISISPFTFQSQKETALYEHIMDTEKSVFETNFETQKTKFYGEKFIPLLCNLLLFRCYCYWRGFSNFAPGNVN